MKYFYSWRYLLSLCLIFATSGLMAQQVGKVVQSVKDHNGAYKRIKFDTQEQQVRMTEVDKVFESRLGAKEADELRVKSTLVDQLGMEHTRYDQYYKGVKVEDAAYIVHAKNGVISSMNGEFKQLENLSLTPTLSAKDALNKAIRHVGAKTYLWQNAQEASMINYSKPEGEQVIIDGKLAYKFDIYALNPISRAYVYVDAQSGKVIKSNPLIHHADAVGTAATRYSGSRSIHTDSNSGNYRLRDYSRGNGIETYDMNDGTNYSSAVDFVDNDNNWTSSEWDNANKDNAALDAHWAAEETYDFWSNTFGRNSFDDNGAVIKSYVHFDLIGYGYPNNDNAFWDGQRMTYGDGTSLPPLTSLDVAAHEIGHAICTYTANLDYSYESGAMNEGFSDIWAASVEHYAAPGKQTWILGEDLGTVIRSMSDPKSAGQPDTYQGTNWATGSADNGGVHTNSGVLNHWYYILSEGKTGTNDNGTSYDVTGVGIDKAAAIAYRLESVYLTSTSQYSDARTYGIQAAEDLYGAGSAEVIATTNAWNAVGIGGKYGEIAYCTSQGNNSSYEWIADVTIGSFNNSSGAAGYSDFTSTTVELSAGSNYSVSLTPDFSGSAYNEYWKIWIDYNADGDFGDSGELVFDAGSLSNSAVNGNISISSSATGTTRMRVSMKYNGAQTECESFSYGEVEDYTVSFSGSTGGDTEAPTAPTSLTASNITQTAADLSWTASTDNVGVTGYDVYVDGSLDGSTSSTNYSLSGLSAGTTYSVSVKAKDAAGNESAAASTNVTTQSGGISCSSTVSLPYSEGFESSFGSWSQATGDDINWTRNSGGTPSSSTGPSAAQEGSNYIYIEASSPNYPSKVATLNGPCVDLAGESAATFNFKYNMYGASMGSLALQASTDGNNWSNIWSKSGNQGSGWNSASVDLASYLGGIVKLRFVGTTGSSYTSDIALDNFSISAGSTGGTNTVTLSITFDNYPEETSWEINDGSNVVASGGTYGSQADGSTLNIDVDLADGCYNLVMKDAYGDGICCSYGNGSYTLTSEGTTLASGGSFASSETTNFCVGSAAMNGFASFSGTTTEGQRPDGFSVYPNPAKEQLNIFTGKMGAVSYQIINAAGKVWKTGNLSSNQGKVNVSDLRAGFYFLKATDGENTVIKKVVKQ